ncbi:MAG: outer membrane lipid asymmetry maintenance protein MlaD [Candidatus Aphodousia sp.]|nr:outer membrane lipid asymmetry maintenance protein MlaD [Sutterella sp.]MDY2900107.1 outer membrane lipid asymmetry maintenance protein MlaD [Candidatus Aphodousia sp.]
MERKTERKRSVELMVGLFVVAGFAALLFTALQAANLGSFSFSQKTYVVEAQFDNIGGLKPRAPVKSAGVVVGRVESITFDNQMYQAKVRMELDSGYEFPIDTEAQILTSGLLGEQYIGLTAGADEEMLEGGSKIRRTQSAMVLEQMISKFMYSFVENKDKE